jgi:small subunit ribosomal protein S16
MATKIRLTRLGKKKQPTYRVVVMDSRKPRDGKYIEQLGIYDPRQQPSLIKIDNERALHWLRTGAQPTERAQKLLEISGAWTQFKVAKGDIHTVAEPEEVRSPKSEGGAEPEAEAEAVAVETADEEVPEADDDGAEAEVAEVVGSQKSEASAEAEVVEEVTADESSEEA